MNWACPICAAEWKCEHDRVEEVRVPASVPERLPKRELGKYTTRERWIEVECANGHRFKASGKRTREFGGKPIYSSVWT
jgi:hypothetical protein